MIPAFASAMQDRALRGHPREVYVWLHEHLDVLDYRPVKHSAIEADLGMEDSSIADAITRLLGRGYIARGPRDGRIWTYRLIYSCPLLPAKPE